MLLKKSEREDHKILCMSLKRNCCKATTYYIPFVANLNKEKKTEKKTMVLQEWIVNNHLADNSILFPM